MKTNTQNKALNGAFYVLMTITVLAVLLQIIKPVWASTEPTQQELNELNNALRTEIQTLEAQIELNSAKYHVLELEKSIESEVF